MNSNMLNTVRNQIGAIAVMAGLAVGFASTAQAAILVTSTQTNSADTSFTPYTVSTTDLINGAAPIASSTAANFAQSFTTGLPVLTDGAFTIADDPIGRGAFADAGPGLASPDPVQFVTYSLGSNALGYDVSSIDVYGGWTGAGRETQGFHVLYSTPAAPSTYLALATRTAFSLGGPDKIGIRTSFTESSLPYVATGVANLRFEFDVAVPNSWSGYSEIDVFGDAVPEPSTVWLLGLGGLLVWKRVRRPQA